MNKGALIEAVAKDVGISKALAGRVLDATIATVKKSLAKGDRVVLAGFGTFSVGTRKARSGRNPQTGQPIQIKASRTARFRAGNKLSAAVGGGRGYPPRPPK
jgi:DNA-binding protein HU-beta